MGRKPKEIAPVADLLIVNLEGVPARREIAGFRECLAMSSPQIELRFFFGGAGPSIRTFGITVSVFEASVRGFLFGIKIFNAKDRQKDQFTKALNFFDFDARRESSEEKDSPFLACGRARVSEGIITCNGA